MRIYLFCRCPEEGKVKTRLAADCGDSKALTLYKKMLETVLQNLKESGHDVLVHTAGDNELEETGWLQGFHHKKQVEGDLGERLLAAVQKGFNKDDDPIVLVGADCLGIDKKLLDEVESEIESNDVVIGPAVDGGYYLLALKEPNAELFTEIDWGTDAVLDQTLMSCKREKLSVAILDEKNDIDLIEDVPQEWRRELNI